jgi:hypothetical protein
MTQIIKILVIHVAIPVPITTESHPMGYLAVFHQPYCHATEISSKKVEPALILPVYRVWGQIHGHAGHAVMTTVWPFYLTQALLEQHGLPVVATVPFEDTAIKQSDHLTGNVL